jgi:hypothetical protein
MKKVEAAETRAVRRALEFLGEALREELSEAGAERDVVGALSGTKHVHTSILFGSAEPCAVFVRMEFTNERGAVEAVLDLARARSEEPEDFKLAGNG